MVLTDGSGLEVLYGRARREKRATAHHLPKLRELASQCDVAVEFGVRSASSTVALLAGGARVYSYDLTRWEKFERKYRELEALVGDRWTFTEADALSVEIPECDLLFIDDLHEYEHVRRELELHSPRVRRWIAMHDTVSYGERGQERVEKGAMSGPATKEFRGILPAIREVLTDPGVWREVYHDLESDGLMVLERVDGAR